MRHPHAARLRRWGVAIALVSAAAASALRVAADPGRRVVPDVVGLSETDAKALLAVGGFAVATSDSAGEPAGTVGAQDPGGFAWAEVGSTVTILVRRGASGRTPGALPPSVGPVASTATVPSVVGLEEDAAMKQVTAAGLVPLATGVTAEPQWAGKVVSQEPAPGAVVARNGNVSLLVGKAGAGLLREAEVPDFVRLSEGEARARAAQSGFTVVVRDRLAGESGGVGRVMEQDPPAGARLLRGRPVSLVVGRLLLLPIRVPETTGLDAATAESTLRDMGFAIETQFAASLPGSAGRVLSQDPAGGTVAYRRSTVRITVGRSLVPTTGGVVAVPVEIGRTEAEARADLVGAGFTVRVRPVQPAEGAPAGRVRGQDPAAGTMLARGSEVVIDVATVSPGAPAPRILVPDYSGTDVKTAEKGLTDLGFRVTIAYVTGTPDGSVVAQAPPPRTAVAAGSVVTLTVARAPTLGMVTLYEPFDRASIPRNYGVTFTWSPVAGAEDYVFEISVNKDGNWQIADNDVIRGTSKRPSRVKGGYYQWHVRARGNGGKVLGPWSEWRRLTIYG